MTLRNIEALQNRLRKLAERPFPELAISQDAQTLSYGQANEDFLARCDADLNLEDLHGFGHYVFHLTEEAHSILVARTLLKYLALFSGSPSEAKQADRSEVLNTFLAFFSVAPNSEFVERTMSFFDESEQAILRDSAIAIIGRELQVFRREETFLDNVENFAIWFES